MQAAPADTLIALATPPGVGAVALLRLRGPAAREIAEKLFSRKLKPRRAVHGELRDPDGSPVDDGLAIYFPAPNSYTGEETVELTPHGSPVIVQRLIEAAILLGARAAQSDRGTRAPAGAARRTLAGIAFTAGGRSGVCRGAN